jgi:hypothetical protein
MPNRSEMWKLFDSRQEYSIIEKKMIMGGGMYEEASGESFGSTVKLAHCLRITMACSYSYYWFVYLKKYEWVYFDCVGRHRVRIMLAAKGAQQVKRVSLL